MHAYHLHVATTAELHTIRVRLICSFHIRSRYSSKATNIAQSYFLHLQLTHRRTMALTMSANKSGTFLSGVPLKTLAVPRIARRGASITPRAAIKPEQKAVPGDVISCKLPFLSWCPVFDVTDTGKAYFVNCKVRAAPGVLWHYRPAQHSIFRARHIPCRRYAIPQFVSVTVPAVGVIMCWTV